MWSFQDQYTHFQNVAKDTSAATLVIGKQNINMGQKVLETELGYPPQEATRSITTTTSDSYPLPENFIRLINLYVTSGTTRYNAEPIYDEQTWQAFKRRTGTTSDYLNHVFIRQNTFEVYPTPSTAGLTMTMLYEALSKDSSAADYTTGTITTLAAAGTAVTASGTTFTAAMVGRYFKINADGQWYRIASRTSDTVIGLQAPYQGTAIAAGTSAFTIGEMPPTPAATHHIPVTYALWHHFEGLRRDPVMGKYYKNQWEEQKAWAKSVYENRTSSQVIPSQRYLKQRANLNPNWFPRDIT